ncbi:hypothetical protein [Nannocystis punicea]|uniref:Uncharacterized protein n=1 Tax=Nannocystis punicea TaxID=2995304 RepID=A0ABY7H3A8_9BACT|nr:hypothetical protein [Nannocystis poenicansa]WAS93749.1 hypothetical protein O0S08_47050 [Nannocystis poenicansa]
MWRSCSSPGIALASVGLFACGAGPTNQASDGAGAATSIHGSTSTGAPTTITTGAISTTDDDPTVGSFIARPDAAAIEECDLFLQDCPEGQKCTALSGDGDGGLDTFRCVPVARDPDAPGETCSTGARPFDGFDSCAAGSICYEQSADPADRVCVSFCTGSPDDPSCPPQGLPACSTAHWCSIFGSGLSVCLPGCDPIRDPCSGSQVCAPLALGRGTIFECLPDQSGDAGAFGDGCNDGSECDPGLFCAEPGAALECDPDAAGCCVPWCDLGQPLSCPGAGQSCQPFYAPDEAPQCEHLGVCRLAR